MQLDLRDIGATFYETCESVRVIRGCGCACVNIVHGGLQVQFCREHTRALDEQDRPALRRQVEAFNATEFVFRALIFGLQTPKDGDGNPL